MKKIPSDPNPLLSVTTDRSKITSISVDWEYNRQLQPWFDARQNYVNWQCRLLVYNSASAIGKQWSCKMLWETHTAKKFPSSDDWFFFFFQVNLRQTSHTCHMNTGDRWHLKINTRVLLFGSYDSKTSHDCFCLYKARNLSSLDSSINRLKAAGCCTVAHIFHASSPLISLEINLNVCTCVFRWLMHWIINAFLFDSVKVAALTCPKQNIGQILRSRTTLPPSCRGSVRRRRPPGPPPACPAPHRAGPACRTSTGTSRQVKEESTGSISQREGQHKCSPVPSHSTLSLRSAMLHRAISKALSAPLWIRVPSPQQQMCVGRGGVKLMVFSPPSLSLSPQWTTFTHSTMKSHQ